jgi:putative ABC transport system ATP-binding protein
MLFFKKIKTKTATEKLFLQQQKRQKKLISLYSPHVETGFHVSTLKNKPDPKKYAVEFFNVEKKFFHKEKNNVTTIFENVNLKIKRGEFVIIFGKTGQGKSTLLNIMSGFEKASAGDVFVNGYNLSLIDDSRLSYFYRDNVSFVFQEPLLLNE